MFNYIVFVNKDKKIIVLDVECDSKYSPDIGYEVEPRWDWSTNNKDLIEDGGIHFDVNKAFNGIGVYKVYGYDVSCDTPDGYCECYEVEKVEKISGIKY